MDNSGLEKRIHELENQVLFYKSIADNTYDWEMLRAVDGKIIYSNQSFEKITGFQNDDFLAGIISEKDFVHPDDFKLYMVSVQNSLKQMPENDLVIRVIHKNKDIRYINLCSTPVYTNNVFSGVRTSARDITEQKFFHELKALQLESNKTEEKYKQYIQNSPLSIFIVNENGKYIYANSSACELLGYSLDEILMLSIPQIIREEDLQAALNNFDEIRINGSASNFEIKLLRKDKSLVDVMIDGIKISDMEYIAYVKDISTFKRDEEIQQSYHKLIEYAIFHDSKDILQLFIDEAEKLTRSNIGFYHLIDKDQKNLYLQTWSSHTLKNMCGAKAENMHYPVDEAGVWVDAVLKKKPVIHNDYTELKHRKGLPEGHVPIVRELVVPVIRNKQIVAILGVGNKSTDYTKKDVHVLQKFADLAWEIAERKKSEELLKMSESKFRSITEQTNDFIAITDEIGRIIYASPASERLFGLSPDEFYGKRFMEFLHEESIAIAMTEFGKALSKKLPTKNLELLMKRKDGSVFTGELSGRFFQDGAMNGTLVVIRDITDRKKTEQELILAKEKAEISQKKYKAILDNTPLAICIYNYPEQDVIFQNEYFTKLLGYSMQDTPNVSDWWQKAYPDENYREAIKNEWYSKTLKALAENKDIEPVVANVTCKNGDVKIIEWGFFSVANEHWAFGVDITEREKYEKELIHALYKTEKLNHSLAEAQAMAKIGNWELDLVTNKLTWSDEIFRIFGCEPQEFKESYEAFLDYIHPNDRVKVDNAYKKHIHNKLPYDIVHRIVLKSNEIKYVHEICKSEFDGNGKAIRSIGTVADITERVFAERELRKAKEKAEKNEQHNQMLFDILPIGLALTKATGELVYVNKEYLNIVGYSEQELLKLSYFDITPERYSKDEELQLKSLNETGFFGPYEKEYRKKSGELVPVRLYGRYVNIDNEKFIWSSVENISQMKNYENDIIRARDNAQEYRTKLTNIEANIENGMIYQIISKGEKERKFSYVSNIVTKFYGCSPQEVMEDPMKIYGKIFKDDLPLVIEAEATALKTMSAFDVEIRMINPDTSLRWSRFTSRPRLYKDNIVWDGIEIDITDYKNTQADLIKARDKAEENDRLKTAFLQNMSHEIRTPMNSITGFSNLLEKPDLTHEKRIKYTSVIKQSGLHLLGIVNDILAVSSLETKQEKLNFENVHIDSLLQNIYAEFQPQADKQNLSFVFKRNHSLTDVEIRCDKTKLNQILSNLITNSLKFTHKGGIEFGFKITGNNAGNFVEFYVKDTGIGIKAEKKDLIFERFVQADRSIHIKYGGTGLGLSICKGFVELFGGKIWFESEPEKGTTFFITIPYNSAVKTIEKQIEQTSYNKKGVILVAEDEEFNFMLIQEILMECECRIIRAKDGQEAVEMCESNPDISIVLMDIKMPRMNGIEATGIIKKIRPDIIIIAQTAHALEHEIKQFGNMGFDEYLTKPINQQKLIDMVCSKLAKKK
jgi:PAS domain S-box-containing protein